MIRNVSDLFKLFGVESEKRLSRAIYKNTECGAWCKIEAPGQTRVGTRTETWTAKVCWSIVGAVPVSARKAHCKKLFRQDFPQHILDYLQVRQSSAIKGISWEDLLGLEGKNGVVKVNQVNNTTAFVTFEVQAPVFKKHRGGITIGSIVEGSDAEVMPSTLYFPFSESDLDATVQDIEDEADRLWHEANDELEEVA